MAIEGITSYYEQNKVKYHEATETECETIINAALDILEDIGVEATEPVSCRILEKAGCTIEGSRVKVPRKLVYKAIDSAPSHIQVYDRNGKPTMDVGGTNVYFGSGPTNPFINDFETGKRRQTVVEDVARSSKVIDACENIDFLMNLADPCDCAPTINDVYSMREMLINSTKPIFCLAVDVNSLKEQFDLVTAVTGGWDAYHEKPSAICLSGSPVTPLAMPDDGLEKLIYCVQNEIPHCFAGAYSPGMTAPITMAGAIAVGLAESFFSLTLSQLINPGCPVIGAVIVYTVHMANMNPCYGTPEHCIADAIVADIFHYLDLPLMATAAASEAKIVDEQYAIEASFTVYANALSGGHLVHDVGFMDSALTTQLDSLTMANEIIGYARRIRQGAEINEETIAMDVIEEVGPKGEFMSTEHTLENFRDEIWTPKLLCRDGYNDWAVDQKDMRSRVREATRIILENHQADPLPDAVLSRFDEIMASANARVGA